MRKTGGEQADTGAGHAGVPGKNGLSHVFRVLRGSASPPDNVPSLTTDGSGLVGIDHFSCKTVYGIRELLMSDVIIVIGPGQIGQAIARRVSAGKHVLLADLHQANADAAAEVLADAGFDVSTATVDVSSRESVHALTRTAGALGDMTGVIHAAGVSPSQARPEVILAVDLYGTALVLEEFGNIIASGGSAVVIASQSGHRLGALTAEQDAALATTPADDLLSLPMLQQDQVTDSLHAYQLAKRGNSLRVRAEAVRWGRRGARVNTISPGIIMTPLARDELTGPRGEGYRRMIELSPARRAGTPDEVGTVGALLMGSDGAFITGSDFLMDAASQPLTSSASWLPTN